MILWIRTQSRDYDTHFDRGNIMVRIALAVLIGLLWAGTIPVTMPWTASIFGLALLNFLLVFRR